MTYKIIYSPESLDVTRQIEGGENSEIFFSHIPLRLRLQPVKSILRSYSGARFCHYTSLADKRSRDWRPGLD